MFHSSIEREVQHWRTCLSPGDQLGQVGVLNLIDTLKRIQDHLNETRGALQESEARSRRLLTALRARHCLVPEAYQRELDECERHGDLWFDLDPAMQAWMSEHSPFTERGT